MRIEYQKLSTRQKKNSKLKGIILPLFCIMLSGYFLHHAINGGFGLNSKIEAEERALHLEFRLAEHRKNRETLAHRVSLLKQGSIEKDMLDEQVRYHLNLIQAEEIVIMRR